MLSCRKSRGVRVRGCEGRCEGKCEGKSLALTLTLTLETPINRAFQPKSEGVRVKKEKNFFLLYCCLNGENPLSEAMGYTVLGGIASLTPSAFPESATGRALTAGNVRE